MAKYISLDQLKDALRFIERSAVMGEEDAVCSVVGAIRKIKFVPADVEPVRRWIPVTERLPEESGEYLVAIGSMLYFSWFYKNDGVWSFMNADVTAWMPLPEPYKGGAEE